MDSSGLGSSRGSAWGGEKPEAGPVSIPHQGGKRLTRARAPARIETRLTLGKSIAMRLAIAVLGSTGSAIFHPVQLSILCTSP